MKGIFLWSEHVGDDFCIFQEKHGSVKFKQLRVRLELIFPLSETSILRWNIRVQKALWAFYTTNTISVQPQLPWHEELF